MSDAEVRAALPLLADEGADLYLAIPAARIGDAQLAALLRDAAAAGVGVRAWILLADEDGYWPNEHNVEAMRAATVAFLDWRDAEQLVTRLTEDGWILDDATRYRSVATRCRAMFAAYQGRMDIAAELTPVRASPFISVQSLMTTPLVFLSQRRPLPLSAAVRPILALPYAPAKLSRPRML